MSEAGALWRRAGRSLIALAIVSLTVQPSDAVEATWPNQVAARYRMQFNGFDVGTYDFVSHFDGKSYSATGKTEISALFGAFKWVGNFAGSGSVESGAPHPASFQMSYKMGSKINSVKMGFDGTGVSTVALVPNKPPNPEAIRLKPENLKNVFDPMAATLAISNATASDACNRTIPVFDGRARFDLRLSLQRPRGDQGQAPDGTAGRAGRLPRKIRPDRRSQAQGLRQSVDRLRPH